MIGEVRKWQEIVSMCEEIPDDDLIQIVIGILKEIPISRAMDLVPEIPENWREELLQELQFGI